jgi:hypothetical protein
MVTYFLKVNGVILDYRMCDGAFFLSVALWFYVGLYELPFNLALLTSLSCIRASCLCSLTITKLLTFFKKFYFGIENSCSAIC